MKLQSCLTTFRPNDKLIRIEGGYASLIVECIQHVIPLCYKIELLHDILLLETLAIGECMADKSLYSLGLDEVGRFSDIIEIPDDRTGRLDETRQVSITRLGTRFMTENKLHGTVPY